MILYMKRMTLIAITSIITSQLHGAASGEGLSHSAKAYMRADAAASGAVYTGNSCEDPSLSAAPVAACAGAGVSAGADVPVAAGAGAGAVYASNACEDPSLSAMGSMSKFIVSADDLTYDRLEALAGAGHIHGHKIHGAKPIVDLIKAGFAKEGFEALAKGLKPFMPFDNKWVLITTQNRGFFTFMPGSKKDKGTKAVMLAYFFPQVFGLDTEPHYLVVEYHQGHGPLPADLIQDFAPYKPDGIKLSDQGLAYSRHLRQDTDCFRNMHTILYNPRSSREQIKVYADYGITQVQFAYAALCSSGQKGATNLLDAREYYKKAADKGHLTSQHNYAVMCLQSQGGSINLADALAYFKKAADKGDMEAQYSYATMCHNGQGGFNLEDAREYYKKAADKGHGIAQLIYAGMCMGGVGGAPNLEDARAYCKKAADQGDKEAQYRYAFMCYTGQEGALILEEDARDYFKRAADQEHKEAQYYYAFMCSRGSGGAPNIEYARAYFKKAADQGHKTAQYHYALECYEEGGGPSLEEAKTYFKMIAASGADDSPNISIQAIKWIIYLLYDEGERGSMKDLTTFLNSFTRYNNDFCWSCIHPKKRLYDNLISKCTEKGIAISLDPASILYRYQLS